MPARVHPKDWDRLFRRGAPQRGGPLRALAHVLIFGIVIAMLIGGALFALQYAQTQAEVSRATQIAQATAGAERAAANRTADALAAVAPSPTVEATPAAEPTAPPLGIGSVVQSGNLRSDTRIAPETVIGQICLADSVAFLDQRQVDATLWYRIRVTAIAADCDPGRVQIGAEGWASSLLLSPPAP